MYVNHDKSFAASTDTSQVIVGDDVLALFNDCKKQGKKNLEHDAMMEADFAYL